MFSERKFRELPWTDPGSGRKNLIFRAETQPARRYLYFRYMLTFQHLWKDSREWAQRIMWLKYAWEIPGPYLRRSMLLNLVTKAGGGDLPEKEEEMTLRVSDSSPKRTENEEKSLADALHIRFVDEEEAATAADSDSDSNKRTDNSSGGSLINGLSMSLESSLLYDN